MARRSRGGYWLAPINDTGILYAHWRCPRRKRIVRRSSGETDRTKAEIWLAEFILQKNRPQKADLEDVMVAQVLSIYLTDHAQKIASAEQAGIAAGHLLDFFGEDRLSDLTQARQRAYITSREVSPGTSDRELSVLRAALRHCWKDGLIKAVPYIVYAETAPEKRSREPKGRPLSIDELAVLFDAAPKHLFMFLLVGCSTLARPDANLDLTPAQVDAEHGLITLNPEGRKQTKKYRPIVPVVETLKPWLATRAPRFVHYYGKPIGSIKSAWRSLRSELNMDGRVQPYSLRHTMAREMRKAKVPGEEISIFLGHQRVDTTVTYAPYDPEYLIRAAEVIDSTLKAVERKMNIRSFDASSAQMADIRNYVLWEKPGKKYNKTKALKVVGAAGIEPATPTMSTKG